MKKITLLLFSFLMFTNFTLPVLAAPRVPEIDTSKKQVLILSSTEKTLFEDSLLDGVKMTFEDNYDEVQAIYANINPYNFESEKNNMVALGSSRPKLELIICLDESVVDFLSYYGKEIFGDTPILFGYAADSINYVTSNMAGYYYPYNIENFLNTVISLHPNSERVNFLIPKNYKGSYFYKKIDEFIKIKESSPLNHHEFNVYETGHQDDVLPKLTEPNSINIVSSTIRRVMNPKDSPSYSSPFGSVELIQEITDNPTYGGLKEFGTRFNLGSYYYDGFAFGQTIGNDAIEVVLNDKNINQIGIKMYNPKSIYYFNEELMKYYNIPSDLNNMLTYDLGKVDVAAVSNTLIIVETICIIVIILLIALSIYICVKSRIYKRQLAHDAVKNNFMANISHELRTPLNIIISTIQLFDVYTKNDEMELKSNRAREKYRYLKSNSYRMLRLVNNIIDMTRLDAGFFELNLKTNDLVTCVEDISLGSVAFSEQKFIELIFDTTVEELYMTFDKEGIERVILNLVSNAIKFTPENGKIIVTINCIEQVAIITVEDTGMGIPRDQLQAVFDRFKQVNNKKCNNHEGSGIGLALCKSIVELHDGTITVESKLDYGSKFIVTLPIRIDHNFTLDDNIPNYNVRDKILVENSINM